MATPSTDPSMQIPSPELVRRIESLVSSLLGVTRSRVERDPSGAIRALRAWVAPGHSPDRVRREIRSALLSSLDLDLSPDVVGVKVEEQLGRRQEEFWEGPDRARELGTSDEERRRYREAQEPEQWLARADASPRSPGDGPQETPPTHEDDREEREERPSAEDWPTAEDQRTRPDRSTAEDQRAEPERRSGEDRRTEGDRRSGSDRRASGTSSASGPGTSSAPESEPPQSESAGFFEPRTPPEARGSVTPVGTIPEEGAHGTGRGGKEPSREVPEEESLGTDDSVEEPLSGRRVDSDRGLLPLSLGEYVLLGGGGEGVGVELRIRVLAGDDRFVGTVRVASLEDVSPGLFVGATLRAVERALDARPVSERSARILILEAVDMEEVVLREGRFLAATVQAVHRDGESRATGLVPAEGRVLREAAAEAALDAVTRILEGRHTTRVEGRGRIRRGPGDLSGGGREERGRGSGSRNPSPAGDREIRGRPDPRKSGPGAAERDPFHVWE